jgi:hypothetical protein
VIQWLSAIPYHLLGPDVQLTVNNLGRLKEAKLDIRPLTVFVGPNHTNKTWTAYSLYGIARNMARIEFATRRSLGFAAGAALQASVKNATERVFHKLTEKPASEVTAGISRDEVIEGMPSTELTFSLDASGLSALLGVPDSTLSGAQAELLVTQDELEHSIFSALEVAYKPSDLELEWRFIRADDTQQSYPYVKRLSLQGRRGPNGSAAESETILKQHLGQAVTILAYTLFDNAAVLPAERKALLSFDFLSPYYPGIGEAVDGALPSPIDDFRYMVSSAQRLRKAPGSRPEFTGRLAQVLGEKILQGEINFEDDELPQFDKDLTQAARRRHMRPGGRGGLSYSTIDGIELGIHASASIVRALGGLDIYLREFCDCSGLLVIDEPEMNAHPEAQLKIIEFVALMVHHGVRVVLTTHSPYIVDHLSNLMQASRLSEDAKQTVAPKFKLGMAQAFLSPDDVSVYLFNESGVVEDILERDHALIDLRSFSRPTEYMANLINAIWKAQDENPSKAVEQDNAV